MTRRLKPGVVCICRESRASYNGKYVQGLNPDPARNKNVEWLRYPHFWWCYFGLVGFFITLLRVMGMEDLGLIFTVTAIVHNFVSCRRTPPCSSPIRNARRCSVFEERCWVPDSVSYGVWAGSLLVVRSSSTRSTGSRAHQMSSRRASTTG